MTVQRLEHIGIVVDDIEAATAFFVALGLEVEGEATVEGDLVDRINGLAGVRSDVVMLRTPEGDTKLELAKYRTPAYEGEGGPAPANAPGIRHVLFLVEDIRGIPREPASARRRAGRRARQLRGHLLALLRARPGGDHRRVGGEDRLMGAPPVQSGARRPIPRN